MSWNIRRRNKLYLLYNRQHRITSLLKYVTLPIHHPHQSHTCPKAPSQDSLEDQEAPEKPSSKILVLLHELTFYLKTATSACFDHSSCPDSPYYRHEGYLACFVFALKKIAALPQLIVWKTKRSKRVKNCWIHLLCTPGVRLGNECSMKRAAACRLSVVEGLMGAKTSSPENINKTSLSVINKITIENTGLFNPMQIYNLINKIYSIDNTKTTQQFSSMNNIHEITPLNW